MKRRSSKKKPADHGILADQGTESRSTQGMPDGLRRDWLWGLILLVAVILIYSPVWWAGYVWDDTSVLTANPVIIGPFGLKEIWTSSAADICPLTLTTFWLEHALWGLTPLPYHLVNVLLHGLSALVLWRVLIHLRIPGAWFGAALWAVHPVEVESVAWVTEMKNTESCLFYLLAILFFLLGLAPGHPDKRTSWNGNYALTLLFAAMALASKSSTVILPIILCLCAWWVNGRLRWRDLAIVFPAFLMSIAAGLASLWTQNLQLAILSESPGARSWPERLATAGDVVWFYLGKLVWPYPLMTVYPRWKIDASQWISYLPLLATLILLLYLWLKRHSWSRPWFFALSYFLVALLPVLGLKNHSFLHYSFVADHFQYLAAMGPLALAGAGMVRLADFVIPKGWWLHSILGAGVLILLGILSWRQARVYESEETLWTATLTKDPNSWPAYNGLGTVLLKRGQVEEAIAQFQKALETNPHYAEAHTNLGLAFLRLGRLNEATAEYREALEINPNLSKAHNNLGNALSQTGHIDEAIEQYKKALEINPNDPEIHNNLGAALFQKGLLNEAIDQFQEALQLKPDYAHAQRNLARVQAMLPQNTGRK